MVQMATIEEKQKAENIALRNSDVKEYDPAFIQVDLDPSQIGGGKLYTAVKRTMDLLLSLVGCILLALPMALIALLIKLDSPGPVIYAQERLGRNGKKFRIYKFRSMRQDAEAAGPRWAAEDDDRCTKIGRVLRKCRLDELPQLYNILRGDMSLVGPRPERECFYYEFETYIPGFKNRMAVRPGLTGHAQVNGGYSLLPEEKIVYDMEYIRKRSVKMDVLCILRTVSVIFSHEGAR